MLSSSFSYVTWLCEGCNSCKLSKSKWEKCKYSSGSYRSNLWRRITRNRSISSTYFVLQLLLRTVEILFKSAVQVYKQMIFRLSPLRHGVSPTVHSSPGLSRFGKKFYVPTCPLEWQEWASINLRTKNLYSSWSSQGLLLSAQINSTDTFFILNSNPLAIYPEQRKP